jgi:hypothetical protein
MIRMSRGARFVRSLVVGTVIFLAGCCGGGPSHKCDFTPAPSSPDGGPDASMPCGTDVCHPPQVCCLMKSPLSALCIDFQNFEKEGCEKPDQIPCLVPADCPGGLSCCLDTRLAGCITPECPPPISCRPAPLCPYTGANGPTFMTCSGNDNCTAEAPNCSFLGSSVDGTVLNVCADF